MHSYDVEANGLSELAEDSDEDSGSGHKRTSFEDANGQKRSETVDGGEESGDGYGTQGTPRRANTLEREKVNTAGSKGFDAR